MSPSDGDLQQEPMTIGGRPVRSAQFCVVRDPATAQVVGLAPDCTKGQLDAAFQSAQDAFDSWRRLPAAERGRLLHSAADETEVDRADLADLLSREQGKPLAEADREVTRVQQWLRWFADIEDAVETVQDDDVAHVILTRRPLGVVAAITPWNVPLALAAWKIAPALRAGNTMVVKPSPYTPLSTLRLVSALNRALPNGVLSAVSGGDELGRWMTGHSVPRKLSFTGSADAGGSVAVAAIADFKRFTLELGGNDAAIVLDDAEPDQIVTKLFWSSFINCGQVCCSVKRLLVPRGREGEYLEALAELASSVEVGHGVDPGTQMGPLNNAAQRDRVAALVADARARGGRVISGADVPDSGFFHAPTVVAGLGPGAALVDEEQFGPALPVIAYDSIDQAVAWANGTRFGLSGSVWSADPARAAEVATQLDCGTTWVNTHGMLAPGQPFGGHRHSGLGIENGRAGYESFSDAQVHYVAR